MKKIMLMFSILVMSLNVFADYHNEATSCPIYGGDGSNATLRYSTVACNGGNCVTNYIDLAAQKRGTTVSVNIYEVIGSRKSYVTTVTKTIPANYQSTKIVWCHAEYGKTYAFTIDNASCTK